MFGPGVEPGVIQRFESKFIVETFGAGAGQLSVRIRGPRGIVKNRYFVKYLLFRISIIGVLFSL